MTDHFVRMAKVDTVSDRSRIGTPQDTIPSTPSQTEFAKQLVQDLKAMGLEQIQMDKHSVVTAVLPTNIKSDEKIPTVALIAHMDISPDAPTKNIQPKIHKKYAGGDLTVGYGVTINAEKLKADVGKDIITSDGTTLLWADNKAGIAEIFEAVRLLQENPEMKRPHIKVVFTPDEEILRILNFMDIDKLGADAAYTMDGAENHILHTESFNGSKINVTFIGKAFHPGWAKNKLVNAIRMMGDFIHRLPKNQSPEATEGNQGFIHPYDLKGGDVEKAALEMTVRDFEEGQHNAFIQHIQTLAKEIKAQYPGGDVNVTVTEQYKNPRKAFAKTPWPVVEYAKQGLQKTGLTPVLEGIRGITDGFGISNRGLPTPNIGSGAQNAHSRAEFVPVQDMETAVKVLVNTLNIWGKNLIKQSSDN